MGDEESGAARGAARTPLEEAAALCPALADGTPVLPGDALASAGRG